MSLKIKVVKEVELKVPSLSKDAKSAHVDCIAKEGIVECEGIYCAECLLLGNNYRKFKISEEQV